MVQRNMSQCPDWTEFCTPYVMRRNALGAALRAVKDARKASNRYDALAQLAALVRQNEAWKAPKLRRPLLRGDPCNPTCGADWRRSFDAARSVLLHAAPQAHAGLSGLGDAMPQTMGPDTARKLARAMMSASKVAPDLYNPASALDQVLEGVQPGLSARVTAKANAMIARGVDAQAAVEQALTEMLVAVAPKYAYPKYPKQPALSGCSCREQDGLGDLGTCGSGTAGLVCAIMEGTGALLTGVNTLATGVMGEQRRREQQGFDQRMATANAERRAAEDAAIRDAGALALPAAAGGIGMGTILLGGLGLAAAGGAIYFLTRK